MEPATATIKATNCLRPNAKLPPNLFVTMVIAIEKPKSDPTNAPKQAAATFSFSGSTLVRLIRAAARTPTARVIANNI